MSIFILPPKSTVMKFIPFLLLLVLSNIIKAQLPASAFSFNKTKDTFTTCGSNCLTLTAKVPFIGLSSGSYTVSKIQSFRANVSPATIGIPTGLLIDDKYSALINLPFAFPFYNNYYQQLAIGANGTVTFDAARANQFAEWNIAADPPSATYARASIMGVFQDVDFTAMTSPLKLMKHELTGVAPYQKWILSFYKAPNYNCNNLINNTYQITLYESLGLIDVHVWEREACTSWNSGKAIIGIQNWEQNKAVTAPGRTASSAVWGGGTMNEAWRFAPKEGSTLLKKVELYKSTGELVANGDTTYDGNGNYNVSFGNVCIGSGDVQYIVKSVYRDMLNAGVELYGADTINVRSSITPSLQILDACPTSSNGSITVTQPLGASYTYSLGGGNYTASPVFSNLSAGNYVVNVKHANNCTYTTVATVAEKYRINTQLAYERNIFCDTETSSSAPVINGTSGGTFTASSPALQINSVSGIINIAASDTGIYTVTYRINSPNSCTNPVATTVVRIVDGSYAVWLGMVDTDWDNPANWLCGNLPTSSSNVIIYGGRQVVIHRDITVNSLTLNPGTTVYVNPANNITILHP